MGTKALVEMVLGVASCLSGRCRTDSNIPQHYVIVVIFTYIWIFEKHLVVSDGVCAGQNIECQERRSSHNRPRKQQPTSTSADFIHTYCTSTTLTLQLQLGEVTIDKLAASTTSHLHYSFSSTTAIMDQAKLARMQAQVRIGESFPSTDWECRFLHHLSCSHHTDNIRL